MHNAESYRIRIAEQLKAARIAAGITVTEVAEATGKNKNTVYGWELGRITPTADVFLQLMLLYGIDDFDFFSPEKKEVVARPDDSMNEFADLLRNADSQSIKAVKAMLTILQDKPDRDNKIVNFNR